MNNKQNCERKIISRLGLAYAWLLLIAALFISILAHADDTVCARVKIEIKQELTFERQAFDAMMKITNGIDTAPLENVDINVSFKDEAGNSVLATSDPNNTVAAFFIHIDTMTGISNVSGTGQVAPAGVAEIHWLIIPAPGSGGIVPSGKLYFVGATLKYDVGGKAESVTVSPDFIYVKPMPLLTLDYFLTRDVNGDDPLTPAIEPIEPYTLGVRIKNTGAAAAKNIKIDSAQPKIVENNQGLLIGFKIIGSFLNDQPASPSLLIPFGDVAANGAGTGRWIMTSTLMGRFVEFSATFSHSDELGGAVTSLIKATNAHFLMRDVKVDLPGRDNVRDFLAKDGDALRVYESNGLDTVASDQSSLSSLTPAGATATEVTYTLMTAPNAGFMLVQLPDPGTGTKTIARVLRADGKTLLSENAWLSKVRNPDNTLKYLINFFDANTVGVYTVVLANPKAEAKPPVIEPILSQETVEKNRISFVVKATVADGAPIKLTADRLPVGARFTDSGVGTGLFEWTPAVGQAGQYSVPFTASANGLTATAAAAITVHPYQPPAAPINVTTVAVPAGKALDFAWSAGLGVQPVRYQLLRATVSGGPYQVVADSTVTTARDTGLTNGVPYYYVVVAYDIYGSASPFSQEITAIPADTLAPVIALHAPALPGETYVTNHQFTNIVAETEAGATVTLLQNGAQAGTAIAPVAAILDLMPIDATNLTAAALSPSGRYLAYSTGILLKVYDLEIGFEIIIGGATNGVFRWSPDGRELVYTEFDTTTSLYLVRAYNVASGGTRDLTDLAVANVIAGVLAPDGKTLAVLADKGGLPGLYKIDSAGIYTALVSLNTLNDIERGSLAWSPDGSRIAYVNATAGRAIEVVEVASAMVKTIEAQAGTGDARWSPDGAALVYTAVRDNLEQVWRYTFATDKAEAITAGAVSHRAAQWSPGGNYLAYVDGANQLIQRDIAQGTETALAQLTGIDATTLAWGRSGYLSAKTAPDKVTRIAPLGRVEFKNVKLAEGNNSFTALAADQYNNQSAASAAINITYDVAAGVTATLTLSAEMVASGTPVTAAYSLTNSSDNVLTALPVIVSVLDSETQTVVASERTLVDIQVNGNVAGSVTFMTVGLALKPYTVTLDAEFTNADATKTVRTLKSAGFRLIDATPPAIVIKAPTSNGFLRGDGTAILQAGDDLTGVALVEINIDGSAWISVPLADATQHLYNHLLPGLPEGLHTVAARAVDGAGNVSGVVTFNFMVDNTTPVVTIAGVEDSRYYNVDVTPTVSIVETNPATSSITLNGAVFASGTLLSAEGGYSLSVQAKDLADNSAAKSVAFTIDKTPPSVAVAGVAEAGLYHEDVTPVIAISDLNLTAKTITLNGAPFVSGTPLTSPGAYTLAIAATDAATNATNAAIHFQLTPPPGPETPVIRAPQLATETITLEPELIVATSKNSLDPTVNYQYELYADPALTTLVAQSGAVAKSANQTAWKPPLKLEENTKYYWRVRGFDGTTYSAWANGYFLVNAANDAPGPAALARPNSTTVDTLTPTLIAANSVDPEGEAVVYTFEVFTDSTLAQKIASAADIAQGGTGTTAWQVTTPLTDMTPYVWRVTATDVHGAKTASALGSFLVDTGKPAPGMPTLVNPLPGSVVASPSVDLTVGNSTKPEGTTLSYIFELDRAKTFDGATKIISGLRSEGTGTTSFSVSGLAENTRYYWRAKSSDGLTDSPWVYGEFFLDQANDPPSAPVLRNAGNASWQATRAPRLEIYPAVDPESDAIAYRFEVYDDAAFTNRVAEQLTNNPTWITPLLADDTRYYWRVRAEDARGGMSAWSAASTFVVKTLTTIKPLLAITSPAKIVEPTGPTLTIAWEVEDPARNTSIALYYDSDNIGADGTRIVDNLIQDPATGTGSYAWNISTLPPGAYYVYGIASNSAGSTTRYAPGALVIPVAQPQGGISVTPTSGLETTEAGGSAAFTVTLTRSPTADVVIGVTSTHAGEGKPSPRQFIFNQSNWSIPQTVTVAGQLDCVNDGDIAYQITTAKAISADPDYAGIKGADAGLINRGDTLGCPSNNPPQASAGPDQTVNAGSLVYLTGSGSDNDGAIASYAWLQTGGPAVTLADANSTQASFTAPLSRTGAVLNFQLTVTDNLGATGVDAMNVTVRAAPNQPPTANAGPNRTVISGAAVTLTGSGADSDGTIAAYAWTQIAGPIVTLTGANTASAGFTAPIVATTTSLGFALTVTDNEGATGSASVVITVVPNQPPTVSAGAAQTVNEGAPVTLTATASDPDGTIASYAWSQIAGPLVTLANANTATASFTAPLVTADTLLTFQITVTDNLGGTASASVNVTVKNVPSQPPVADAGGPYAAGAGIQLPLNGSLSKDPENQPLSYRWNFGDGATGAGVTPSHAYTAAGTYVVTLIVNDGEQDSAPALTTVLVAPVVAGSVGVAIKPDNVTIQPSTLQAITIAATNTTGVTLKRLTIEYSYSSSNLLVGNLLTSPIAGTATIDTTARRIKLSWTNVPNGAGGGAIFTVASPVAGTYTLSPAKVEYVLADNSIHPLTANSATIKVSTTGNKAPSVNAGANQSVNEGTLVQLQGSATDTDGVVVNYFWRQTAGPAVTLSNAFSKTPTFTAPLVTADTVLSFRLFAIDNAWAVGAASTSVTVKNVP